MTDAELLAAAKAAQHKLLTGSAVAEFKDQNGETVRYHGANRGSLASYIADLERRVAGRSGSGPMRVLM